MVNASLEALRSAHAALESGHFEDGFTLLLQAWRNSRTSALRDLVELAGEALAPPLHLEGKTQRQQRADWVARVRWKRPLELSGLLDCLDEPLQGLKPGPLVLYLDELISAKCSDDPRIASRVMRILRHHQHVYGDVSSGFYKVHTRCLKLLRAANDPFVITELNLLGEKQLPSLKRCAKLATALSKKLGEVPEQSDTSKPLCASIEELLFAAEPLAALRDPGQFDDGTMERLLEDIILEPDNTALCAVYSDLAQEEGLAQGEFIALRLESEKGKSPSLAARCDVLAAKHWKTWLGPVARYTSLSQIVFRHGFPYSAVTTVGRYLEVDAAFSGEELATLREIEFRGFGKISLAMRNIRMAKGVNDTTLYDLCQQGHPTLEVLSIAAPLVDHDDGMEVDLTTLQGQSRGRLALREVDQRALPKLHTLIFEGYKHSMADYSWVHNMKIYDQLQVVQHP